MAIRPNTLRFGIPLVVASLTSGVDQAMTTITLDIPETTSRTFRSVRLVANLGDEVSGASNFATLALKIQLGAAGTDTVTFSDTVTNSGENTALIWWRDCTAYFNTNFGAGASQTFTATATYTGGANAECLSAYLVVTYEHSDVDNTRAKSVCIPFDGANTALTSSLANLGGVASQIPNLSTFLPEGSVSIKNMHVLSWFNEGRTLATLSSFLGIQLDGATELTDNQHVSALNSARAMFRVDECTSGFTTNATHSIQARRENTSASFNCLTCVLWVTYTYSESGTTGRVLNSVIVPMGSVYQTLKTATGDKDRLQVEFDIEEPGTITLVQSAVMVATLIDGAYVMDIRMGTQASRTFTYGNCQYCGGVYAMRRIDAGESGGVAGVTLARGRNTFTLDVFQTSALTNGTLSAWLILNYTSDKASDSSLHNRTLDYGVAAVAADAIQRTIAAAAGITPNIPESNYFLQGVGIEAMYFFGGAAQADTNMVVTVERQAGEGAAAGWQTVGLNQRQDVDGELGVIHQISTNPAIWKRHPADADTARMDLETQRDWNAVMAPLGYSQLDVIYTRHAITTTKSGTVRGFTGDGSGITVTLYNTSTGEKFGTATTAAGGTWSTTVYNNVDTYIAVAEQDANRVGSSRALATNTLDIDLGRRGPIVGPHSGIVRAA